MTTYTPALDGVRGIAILLVLFHHFTVFEPLNAVDRGIGFLAALGWSGVDVFFVLSGFLITGILIDARGSRRYFSSFYMRRSLRIFPLYFLVVFLSFAVLPLAPALHDVLAGPTPVAQWPYWTYLVNFAVAERGRLLHGVLDVAWSLAIEEQFYVVWAVVVWLLAPRLLGPLCAAIVIAVPILRNIAVSMGVEPMDVYVLPHMRADALALGGWLAWVARRERLHDFASAAPLAVAGGFCGALMLAVAASSAWWWEPGMQRFGFSLLAIGGGGLVVAAMTTAPGSLWQRTLSAGWLRACGKYSYCMYLIHLPVSRLLREYVIAPADFPAIAGALWPAQVGFYAVAGAATFAVAWLSWQLFEAPILRLKARFPYSEVQAVSAP